MNTKQFVRLFILTVVGMAWIFYIQNLLLSHLLQGLLVTGGTPLTQLLDSAISPSFSALWFSCFAATIIWLVITSRNSPMNSAEVLRMRPRWWLFATILVLLGLIYQVTYTVLIWKFMGMAPVEGMDDNYFRIPVTGWSTLLALVVVDVGLLFWLPTLFASPKSYRFVVPGALFLGGGR